MQASPLARRSWPTCAPGGTPASYSPLTAAALDALCAGLPAAMFVVGYDTLGPVPLCLGAGLADVLQEAPAQFTAADFAARLHPDDAALVVPLTALVAAFVQQRALPSSPACFSCCFRLRSGPESYVLVQRCIALAKLRPAHEPQQVLHYYTRLPTLAQPACFSLSVPVPGFWPWLWERLKATGLPWLTPRQREILGLLLAGLTNRQVADQLCLAENTIKTHHRALCAKAPERDIRRLAWLLGE